MGEFLQKYAAHAVNLPKSRAGVGGIGAERFSIDIHFASHIAWMPSR
jgi:hypothetical protein